MLARIAIKRQEDPSSSAVISTLRENLAFYADHLYLKTRYSRHHAGYMKFFLGSAVATQSNASALESEFLKSYPLPASLVKSAEDLVKGL